MASVNKVIITWTKCSDRMPPVVADCKLYLVRKIGEKRLSRISAGTLSFIRNRERYEWTPYTPAAWAELNK